MTNRYLPELPCGFNALEPNISAETLHYHYLKHHVGYAKKLQALVGGTKLQGVTLEDLITFELGDAIFNNAAQLWNHNFYWKSMTPDIGSQPSSTVKSRFERSFGSLAKFKKRFAEIAIGRRVSVNIDLPE